MKQIMKRASLMLISLMTMWYANAETIVTVDGLQYSLSGAYAAVYRVASDNTTIIIPKTINYQGMSYTVNEIASKAFHARFDINRNVQNIFLPNTIRKIGDSAFADWERGAGGIRQYFKSNIQKVVLEEGVETIGSCAFSNRSLNEVNLTEGVIEIGGSAFLYAKITSLVIPSTVTKMGYGTHQPSIFEECDKLRKLI